MKLSLPLKVGQKCVTRSGAICRVICVDLKGSQPVVAAIESDHQEYVYNYSLEGKYYTNDATSKNDLISDYQEPKFRPWKFEEIPVLEVVKWKGDNDSKYAIIAKRNNKIKVANSLYSPEQLFNLFIRKDGSPCGVKEI